METSDRAVEAGHWRLVEEQWRLVAEQWRLVEEQWRLVAEQWRLVEEQWRLLLEVLPGLMLWLQWLQWGVTFSQVVWLIGC